MLGNDLSSLEKLNVASSKKKNRAIANTDRNKRLFILLGGRSGRVRMAKDEDTGEYIQVIDDGNSSPLLEIVYTFFGEPQSSPAASLWCATLSLLGVLRVIAMACETTDGPQYYKGRENNASIKWMPDHDMYYALYLILSIPLALDALARLIVLATIFTDYDGNVCVSFRNNRLERYLTFGTLLGVVPFIAGLYLHPGEYSYDSELLKSGDVLQASQSNEFSLTQLGRVLLRLSNLLVCSHAFRYLKDVHIVKTITRAVERAGPHLVLPVFFFFVFNFIAGVVFYFIEPCYDQYSCPWNSLFSSTFFSIVTMTTVGYGNQVPVYDHSRVFTIVVMISGSLFLSMPLALIGNEYTDAVIEIDAERDEENIAAAERMREITAEKETYRMQIDSLGRLLDKSDAAENEDAMTEYEKIEWAINKSFLVQYLNKMLMCANFLESELLSNRVGRSDQFRLTSRAFLIQSELMASLAPLMIATRSITLNIVKMKGGNGPNEEESKDDENIAMRKGKKRANSKLSRDLNFNRKSVSIDTDMPSSSENESENDSENDDDDDDDDDFSLSSGSESEDDLFVEDIKGDGSDYIQLVRQKLQNSSRKSVVSKKTARSTFREALDKEHEERTHTTPGRASILSRFLPASFTRTAAGGRGTLRTRAESSGSGFKTKLRRVLMNPNFLKNRLWMLMELPHSSKQAMWYRRFILCLMVISIGTFILETTTSLTDYGPTTQICGAVLVKYCVNKGIDLDPGCFVQSLQGPIKLPLQYDITRYPYEDVDITQWKHSDTLYEYYDEDIPLSREDAYHLDIPGKSETQMRLEARLQMLRTCYPSQMHLFNEASQSFPWRHANSTHAGYIYELAKGGILNLNYPLNECHRHGFNFGTHFVENFQSDQVLAYSNVSCSSNDQGELIDPNKKGFASSGELIYTYGQSSTFTSRKKMHEINAICNRLECGGSLSSSSGDSFFFAIEYFCFFVFFSEFLVRYMISDSTSEFVNDYINFLDFVALSPFIITILSQSLKYPLFDEFAILPMRDVKFSIVSTSPADFYTTMTRSLVVLRLVRLVRQFTVTTVLVDTAKKCWRQILAMTALFTMVLLVFSVILFEFERGTVCFVAPAGTDLTTEEAMSKKYCTNIPSDVVDTVHEGERLIIDKNGDLSVFGSMVECLWFCFVTATTVGYGDKWPVTNGGMFVNLFLMLMGSMYLAMPLTVAASTYATVHQKYLQTKKKAESAEMVSNSDIDYFRAEGFTSAFENKLQEFYDALKAENTLMQDIMNDLKRDLKHFAVKNERGESDSDLDSEELRELEEMSDFSEETERIEKPNFADKLLRSVWKVQRAARTAESTIRHLSKLDLELNDYLDDVEALLEEPQDNAEEGKAEQESTKN